MIAITALMAVVCLIQAGFMIIELRQVSRDYAEALNDQRKGYSRLFAIEACKRRYINYATLLIFFLLLAAGSIIFIITQS